EGGLEALAQELGGGPAVPPDRPVLEAPAGELSVGSLGRALAASLREGDIVVEEGNTSGAALTGLAAHAPPHRAFGLTGGAIGQGLPSAVGAAVGAPGCRVLALEADGSGMYTLQALWTMAREALDVTVVVASNRSYRILKVELAQAGMVEPGPAARALTDLDRPDLDWPLLSRGMGVPGVRVETADELVVALERARAEPGPSLVEAILP
ncbi:MAG: thiamine pyrophosphate-dependent enzyme, partial [Dehalococcoidia bacterium]